MRSKFFSTLIRHYLWLPLLVLPVLSLAISGVLLGLSALPVARVGRIVILFLGRFPAFIGAVDLAVEVSSADEEYRHAEAATELEYGVPVVHVFTDNGRKLDPNGTSLHNAGVYDDPAVNRGLRRLPEPSLFSSVVDHFYTGHSSSANSVPP